MARTDMETSAASRMGNVLVVALAVIAVAALIAMPTLLLARMDSMVEEPPSPGTGASPPPVPSAPSRAPTPAPPPPAEALRGSPALPGWFFR
jgi:hypothetical protein